MKCGWRVEKPGNSKNAGLLSDAVLPPERHDQCHAEELSSVSASITTFTTGVRTEPGFFAAAIIICG